MLMEKAGSLPAAGQKKFHYGFVILLLGILTTTGAVGFARYGYTTILPSMMEGLGLDNTGMGLMASGNLAGYMIFSLVAGFLASKYSPRIVILFSMLMSGGTMLLTGLAGNLWTALTMRALTGLGSAGSYIPMMGMISAWFAPHRRGMASGVLVAGSGVALLVTGFLVPRIVSASPLYGWRISWFILGLAVVLLGLVIYLFLRNKPADLGLKPVGAESETAHESGAGAEKDGSAVTEVENDSGGGAGWKNVYGSRTLWLLGLVYFAFGFSYIIYATFFSTSLVADKGISQEQAGSMWALIGLISIFSGVLWGVISDYIGRKFTLCIIFALMAVSYLLFALGGSTLPLYVSAVIFAITSWSIPGVVAAACGDYVGARLAPAALGMVTLFFGVGQAIAPGVAGYTADLTGSFDLVFILAAIVAGLGSVGSLTLRSS